MSAINQVASDTSSEVFQMRTIFSTDSQDSNSISNLPESSHDVHINSPSESSISVLSNGDPEDICVYNEVLSDLKVPNAQSPLGSKIPPASGRVVNAGLCSPRLVKDVKCESKCNEKKINQILSDSSSQKTITNSGSIVKRERKAKIYSIEELFDSSSDLDLPCTPPPPPPIADASANVPPVGAAERPYTVVQTPPTVETLQSHPPEVDVEKPLKSALKSSAATSEPILQTIPEPEPILEVIEQTAPERDTMSANCVSDNTRNSMSLSTTPPPSTGISENHYERLIEELKCPGCASPMRAPVRMCATGHSICEKCTTALMLCPLCTSPFIDLRSRTVEALCSKALFRCQNAAAGCTCRLQLDLLDWHQKQCIYKSMKCFMGRVWGECSWTGLEANWKEHLERKHSNKVFTTNQVELLWDLNNRNKPLAGYYVFLVFDEMFNFYQVYDRDRILFTMTVTSSVRERKLNFAYEVEMFHKNNEALCITQRFPVHSEYDKDILLDGTCVSVSLTDLARLLGQKKILHFRVRIHEVKSPKKSKPPTKPSRKHPIDFQQTKIEGANLKSVPAEVILTRKPEDSPLNHSRNHEHNDAENSEASSSLGDPENEMLVAKNWGTPQMNFNRKYLRSNGSKESCSSSSASSSTTTDRTQNGLQRPSCESTNSKMRSVTSSIRKSFRSLKTDIIDLKKPFSKKSPEKKESLIKK